MTTHAPTAAGPSNPTNEHQKVAMDRIRRTRPIRRLAAILAGLTAALLAAAAAAPAAFARPAPPTAVPPTPLHLPPPPPGWNKHPPLPGPAHLHAALAVGLPSWQITLIAAVAAVIAAVLAVITRRMRAARRRVPATTAEAMTASGAAP